MRLNSVLWMLTLIASLLGLIYPASSLAAEKTESPPQWHAVTDASTGSKVTFPGETTKETMATENVPTYLYVCKQPHKVYLFTAVADSFPNYKPQVGLQRMIEGFLDGFAVKDDGTRWPYKQLSEGTIPNGIEKTGQIDMNQKEMIVRFILTKKGAYTLSVVHNKGSSDPIDKFLGSFAD